MELMVPPFIIAVLIAINGFFVAAEFALIGAPRTAVEKEADEGSVLAQRVIHVMSNPRKQDQFIATAQLGITLASLGLGMYGEHSIAKYLEGVLNQAGWGEARFIAAHSMASFISVTFLTYLHIVFGEMIPKSLALQAPQKVVKWITPFMQVIQLCVYPMVLVLNAFGDLILAVLGIRRREGTEQLRSPEELSYIVDESEVGGELGKESADVLRELLEFGELTAEEVMVPRTQMVGIATDMTGDEIQSLLRRRPHTRYVVYENDLDKIVGFIHVKDLLRLVRTSGGIPEEAVRPIPFVPGSSHLESVLRGMRKSRSQMTVVMDEHGGTAGLLTIEDLFEEVVGDISEDKAERPEIHRLDNGNYLVQGTVRLAELGEELTLELENETVDTVSGLVLAMLERPAQVGDEVYFKDVTFRVASIRGRGVAECLVTPPAPVTESSEE